MKMQKWMRNLIMIFIGNVLLAIAGGVFILPNQIVSGGVNGVALVLEPMIHIPVNTLINILIAITFVCGFIFMGKEFAGKTIVSSIIYPILLELVMRYIPSFTYNILIATVISAVLVGFGIGLVLRAGASTGGMDIPPLVLNKKTGISTTVLINGFDCIILALQVPFSNVEQILYGILVVLITALVMDKMILLGESKIQVLVISPKWNEVQSMLYDQIDRGCTLMNITTGYKKQDMYAVMSVVSRRELVTLTNEILKIDEAAFIITNETHNVRGRGFTLPNIDL